MTHRERIANRIIDNGGHLIACVDGPNKSRLDFYILNGTVLILQEFNGGNGIELYTTLTTKTMEGLEIIIDRRAKL